MLNRFQLRATDLVLLLLVASSTVTCSSPAPDKVVARAVAPEPPTIVDAAPPAIPREGVFAGVVVSLTKCEDSPASIECVISINNTGPHAVQDALIVNHYSLHTSITDAAGNYLPAITASFGQRTSAGYLSLDFEPALPINVRIQFERPGTQSAVWPLVVTLAFDSRNRLVLQSPDQGRPRTPSALASIATTTMIVGDRELRIALTGCKRRDQTIVCSGTATQTTPRLSEDAVVPFIYARGFGIGGGPAELDTSVGRFRARQGELGGKREAYLAPYVPVSFTLMFTAVPQTVETASLIVPISSRSSGDSGSVTFRDVPITGEAASLDPQKDQQLGVFLIHLEACDPNSSGVRCFGYLVNKDLHPRRIGPSLDSTYAVSETGERLNAYRMSIGAATIGAAGAIVDLRPEHRYEWSVQLRGRPARGALALIVTLGRELKAVYRNIDVGGARR